ncbi:MAG: DUF4164 family protein [Geminicoccaceae bacterium]
MSELEAAQRHLKTALDRLEAAVTRQLSRSGAGLSGEPDEMLARLGAERADLARHVGVLRSECDRLSAALSESEQDNQSLRQVSGQVAKRLDGSIAEIDRLLEG